MPSVELLLLAAAGLLTLAVVASKASTRFGVPALVLFLGIGMLAGSDGPGGIYFDYPWYVQAIGTVALVFILFSGGLDSDWQAIRPILVPGLVLANIGVVISAGLMGAFAALVLGYSWLEGLLLGAIVSSTDAAAVFAVMRASGVNLEGQLEPLIEFESGTNDPIAVFLTVALTGLLITPGATALGLVPAFVLQMLIGGLAGYGLGRLGVAIINRLHLTAEGLYAPLMIALVLLIFGATAVVGGNGFLAVYVAGVTMSNRDFVHKRSLASFHDGLAWLMQIAMFIVLGLQVYPTQLVPIVGQGLLAAAFLTLVARPASVFLALTGSRFNWRERAMVAWVGLRGAVPIVLATYPLLAGAPRATQLFHVVFFIVLASVLVQGTTIPFVGKLLRLNRGGRQVVTLPQAYVPQVTLQSQIRELVVPNGSNCVGRSIVELGLPRGALVVLIHRDDGQLVPNGATVLEPQDRLMVLADGPALAEMEAILRAPA